MKHFSKRRRQVVLAGLAGAAAPAAVLAAGNADAPATTGLAHTAGQAGLVVSGRVLAADGQPLAGTLVEIWRAGGAHAGATTDGDGRFYAAVPPAAGDGRPRRVLYRVTRDGRTLAARAAQVA